MSDGDTEPEGLETGRRLEMIPRSERGFRYTVLVAALAAAVIVAGCGGGDEEGTGYHRVAEKKEKPFVPAQTQPPVAAREKDLTVEKAEAAEVEKLAAARKVTYEKAEEAYLAGRYGEAVELFTAYTKRRDENHWGWYMLGLSARRAGDPDLAAEALERSLEIAPGHVKSMLNLARVRLDAGRAEGALEILEGALEADQESNAAYRLRGVALGELGRSDEAAESYRLAIAIDGNDAWSMNNLGHLHIEEGEFEKALPPLALATRIDSTVAVFWNNLGMVLERSGDFRAAEKAYDSALNADEGHEKAFANWTRVREVDEEPGIGKVDLAAAAESFIEDIEQWKLARSGQDAAPAPAADSLVAGVTGVILPDSSSAGPVE